MYSREERMKAVEIYIKYDKSAADAIRENSFLLCGDFLEPIIICKQTREARNTCYDQD